MLIALKTLVVLSVLVLILGLIKPKWVVFWMKEPDRVSVTAIAMLMFMGAWTGIAKLTLKPKEHQEQQVEKSERSRDEMNQIDLTR